MILLDILQSSWKVVNGPWVQYWFNHNPKIIGECIIEIYELIILSILLCNKFNTDQFKEMDKLTPAVTLIHWHTHTHRGILASLKLSAANDVKTVNLIWEWDGNAMKYMWRANVSPLLLRFINEQYFTWRQQPGNHPKLFLHLWT